MNERWRHIKFVADMGHQLAVLVIKSRLGDSACRRKNKQHGGASPSVPVSLPDHFVLSSNTSRAELITVIGCAPRTSAVLPVFVSINTEVGVPRMPARPALAVSCSIPWRTAALSFTQLVNWAGSTPISVAFCTSGCLPVMPWPLEAVLA